MHIHKHINAHTTHVYTHHTCVHTHTRQRVARKHSGMAFFNHGKETPIPTLLEEIKAPHVPYETPSIPIWCTTGAA